jgi:hypothetical protein
MKLYEYDNGSFIKNVANGNGVGHSDEDCYGYDDGRGYGHGDHFGPGDHEVGFGYCGRGDGDDNEFGPTENDPNPTTSGSGFGLIFSGNYEGS